MRAYGADSIVIVLWINWDIGVSDRCELKSYLKYVTVSKIVKYIPYLTIFDM